MNPTYVQLIMTYVQIFCNISYQLHLQPYKLSAVNAGMNVTRKVNDTQSVCLNVSRLVTLLSNCRWVRTPSSRNPGGRKDVSLLTGRSEDRESEKEAKLTEQERMLGDLFSGNDRRHPVTCRRRVYVSVCACVCDCVWGW